MKKIILLLISFLALPQTFADQAPSPRSLSMFAKMLNIKTTADLQAAKADLKAIDNLECFKENRFVTDEGILRITTDKETFNKLIYKATSAGVLESIFWGRHASDHYQLQMLRNNFFNFPPMVWSLKDNNVEMIVTAHPELVKEMSRSEYKARFTTEAQKLKSLIPGMKVECAGNNSDIYYAKSLIFLLDSPDCETILASGKTH